MLEFLCAVCEVEIMLICIYTKLKLISFTSVSIHAGISQYINK